MDKKTICTQSDCVLAGKFCMGRLPFLYLRKESNMIR